MRKNIKIANIYLLSAIFSSALLADYRNNEICEYVLKNKSNIIKTKSPKQIDINNDGKKEFLKESYGGTMRIKQLEFYNNAEDLISEDYSKEIQFKTIGYEWKTYWAYEKKPFSYKQKQYILHSYDDEFKKLAYVDYATPENKQFVVCEFVNDVKRPFVLNKNIKNAKEICNEKEIKEIVLKKVNEKKIKRWTYTHRYGKLDYNNDKIAENLLTIAYASGAGRGCDFNYFDIYDYPNLQPINSKNRDLLLKMQNVDLEAFHPNCGGYGYFFNFNGINYYFINTKNDKRISYIKNNKIIDVCKAKTIITTKIKN